MSGSNYNIPMLYTISLAISSVSHRFVLIFEQYRTILVAIARTGS